MDINRILEKLDSYFSRNDYEGAERHLKYWMDEATATDDQRGRLSVCNELIGLYRKVGNAQKAFECVDTALDIIRAIGIEDSVSAATTYINAATAYKAFDRAEESLPLFERALTVYERYLEPTDPRLGGLYNNYALTLADLHRFADAYNYFDKALEVMSGTERGELEQAITYLNIADTTVAHRGLFDSADELDHLLPEAMALLDKYKDADDGYYAFVCEKCAPVFDYYGYFAYKNELEERARRIYERN